MTEYLTIAIVVICVGLQVYGAIGLTICIITLRRAHQQLDELLAEETSPQSPAPPKKIRLFRRQAEPEPGGTKVWPREPWDEGLEREDV